MSATWMAVGLLGREHVLVEGDGEIVAIVHENLDGTATFDGKQYITADHAKNAARRKEQQG